MAQNQTVPSKKYREPKLPAMIAWHVSDRGKHQKGFWTRIGAAWSFKEGEGYTVTFDLLPSNGGRIVLMPPKAKDEQAGNAETEE